MHVAKFLVPHCLHKTLNVKKLWMRVQYVKQWFVPFFFSFSKHPLFLIVHWSSNKGQIPACPGQHAEDIKLKLGFSSYHAKRSAVLLPDSWQHNIQLASPVSRSSSRGAGLMLHSQGEASSFPSTPTVLRTPAPAALGKWRAHPQQKLIQGMGSQREAELKGVEETWGPRRSCRSILVWNLQRDFPSRVFTLLTYTQVAQGFGQSTKSVFIDHCKLFTVKTVHHTPKYLVTDNKCLHKSEQISICSTTFLTKSAEKSEAGWRSTSKLMCSLPLQLSLDGAWTDHPFKLLFISFYSQHII